MQNTLIKAMYVQIMSNFSLNLVPLSWVFVYGTALFRKKRDYWKDNFNKMWRNSFIAQFVPISAIAAAVAQH